MGISTYVLFRYVYFTNTLIPIAKKKLDSLKMLKK